MGTLKTTNIQTITGSGTLTLGTSGETLALGSGVTSNLLHPAFEAYLSSNQSVTDNTMVKAQFDTENFDTDNCYDNSTNYRFTPTVAGKYYVYAALLCTKNVSATLVQGKVSIYKNGSEYVRADNNFSGNNIYNHTSDVYSVIDMNGTTDYLEVYGESDSSDGSGQIFLGNSVRVSKFGAYRIGT